MSTFQRHIPNISAVITPLFRHRLYVIISLNMLLLLFRRFHTLLFLRHFHYTRLLLMFRYAAMMLREVVLYSPPLFFYSPPLLAIIIHLLPLNITPLYFAIRHIPYCHMENIRSSYARPPLMPSR